MVGDNFRLNKQHPNFHQILATKDSVNYISRQIQDANRNFSEFTWVLITLFVGIIFSFLLSYKNSSIYWTLVIIFAIFSLIILHIYLQKFSNKKLRIKELKEERDQTLGHLYILGFFNNKTLFDYMKKGAISRDYYNFLKDISEVEIEKNQFSSYQVEFLDGKSEIYPKAIYDNTRKILEVYDSNKQIVLALPLENRIKQIIKLM